MAQEEHEIQLRELIVKYIHDSIGGQWKNEDEFVIKDDIKVKPLNSLPKVDRVEDEFLRNLLQSSLKGKSIINIPVFLTQIISYFDDKIKNSNNFMPTMMVLDEQNLEKKFKEKFIGCYKACPLCRRKCDQAHTGLNEKHKCATGHQFKVFGGTRFKNNDPSFVSCDMMKDNDDVEFEGEIKKWQEFRLSQPDWDFMCESSLDRGNFIERNKDIWNLISTELCEYYLKNKNIKINPKEWFDQNNFIKSTHLILLLDDSGSMCGKTGESTRWNDLLKAVMSTFETIMNNNFLKLKTKISVLLHSSTTISCFEEKEASIDLINSIKPRYNLTNFEEAISEGYKLILESEKRYDTIIVGFMSDGGCSIPTRIIDVINKDEKNVKNKISFNCIMFGDDDYGRKTQKEIADRLGGKFTNALTVDDLKASFIEILNVKN